MYDKVNIRKCFNLSKNLNWKQITNNHRTDLFIKVKQAANNHIRIFNGQMDA